MKKEKVLQNTIQKLQTLPEIKLKEVNDFVDFLKQKVEDHDLTTSIQTQASNSKSFAFLEEEEELYTTDDLKNDFK